jgi:glycosidase
MSRRQDLPSVVYEAVPDRFAAANDEPALVAIQDRLEHLASLHVDALVFSPLFPASDPLRLEPRDLFHVDPALGTEADLIQLCARASELGIDVVLSGVFDHVSAEHDWFRSARDHTDDEGRYLPEERTRGYFSFGDEHEHGYACRDGDPDRPELDLKNPELRRRLFTGEHSVFHHWLHTGVRGWRILRADAVGYSILRESSRASLTVAGDHFIVGDVKGFADRYVRDGILDGVVGHYQREAVLSFLRGQIPARQLARVMRDVASRYGAAYTNGWNLLSGHDTDRVQNVLKDPGRTRLAVLLSYALPGAAHVFYGDEIGGLRDPLGDMQWNETRWDGDRLALHRALGKARKEHRGLIAGDFVDLTPEGEDEILAFARVTNDPRDTVIVAINRAAQTRVRKLFAPVCDLPDGLKLRDLNWVGGAAEERPDVKVRAGSITLELDGQDARVLVPHEEADAGARFFRGY